MTKEVVYGPAPRAQGFTRPTVWTKRRKSAVSLMAIMGLLLGIAVAFKLFDQTVPNNVVRDASSFDYEIFKWDTVVGDTNWVAAAGGKSIFQSPYVAGNTPCTGTQCPGDIYPGDTRTVDVRIANTNVAPAKDASFEVYIQNIMVVDASDPFNRTNIQSTDPRFTRFVSFFTFAVDKQNVLNSSLTGDISNDYPLLGVQYSSACSGELREITRNSPCQLGVIRAAGSESLLDDPTDERLYRFKVTEADDGTDQSAFKGWNVRFDLVFSARVPAVNEDEFPIGER